MYKYIIILTELTEWDSSAPQQVHSDRETDFSAQLCMPMSCPGKEWHILYFTFMPIAMSAWNHGAWHYTF
jgi:hypothetical protein